MTNWASLDLNVTYGKFPPSRHSLEATHSRGQQYKKHSSLATKKCEHPQRLAKQCFETFEPARLDDGSGESFDGGS